jgi:hypothetical protein
MTELRVVDASPMAERAHGHEQMKKTCDEVGEAIDKGKIGEIVAKHEKLILQYYGDVQDQAKRSFDTALKFAKIGFGVLIGTLLWVLFFDVLARFQIGGMTEASFKVASMGVVSGIFIEFIAAVAFVLYARGAKQFGAFHICLERTHRYLLAYKIAEQLGQKKEDTFRDLVCIMANAPMITMEAFGSSGSVQPETKTRPS